MRPSGDQPGEFPQFPQFPLPVCARFGSSPTGRGGLGGFQGFGFRGLACAAPSALVPYPSGGTARKRSDERVSISP